MSVAARSPVQCPAGSRTRWPRPAGVWRLAPVSQSSSRPVGARHYGTDLPAIQLWPRLGIA
jgi:hypothetical protein